ncbi:helix-turn-helix domain-containing protein [Nocardioides thalensis]|uniref:helix-turn-helix transcriptional regulator n=1 Tax=Nocardioides thalensis TaxID=1914755 RepID=UPI0015C8A8AA
MSSTRRGHIRLSAGRTEGLAANVREARHLAGLTQEGLALASGLTSEHVRRIERGVANPTLATVYALADALDRSACSLLVD